MMSDIENLAVMPTDAHEILAPEVNVPADASQWAREVFPPLIKAIYANVNKNLQNVIID